MATPLVDLLAAAVARRANPAAAAWFAAQLSGAGDFLPAFSAAGRRLGAAEVPDPSLPFSCQGRGLDEIGRVALLLARLDSLPQGHEALVADLFYRGDAREKQAVLRALPLLPQPARFVELGVEAVRSSVQTIFEAIACENPYPADHFSGAAFNQLVLKALFNEVSVARIAGLDRRATSELSRMAEGYGSERRAAGRSVPEDIAAIVALARRD